MENFEELKDIGSFRFIRSAKDKNAMIGWHKKEYDETSNRWFESTGCGFCDWDDARALQEADEIEMMDYRATHPEYAVRESFWQITCGEDDVVAEQVLVVLEEYENGEHHAYDYIVDDIPLEELERWKKAVYDWHITGVLKMGAFKYKDYTNENK